jgi:hypothetical protein
MNAGAPGAGTSSAAAGSGLQAPGVPEAAGGPTPEQIATDKALRTPINLTEGVDFSYSSYIPPIVYEETLTRLVQADPALAEQLKRASQSIPSATYGVGSVPAKQASAPLSSQAVWPLTG